MRRLSWCLSSCLCAFVVSPRANAKATFYGSSETVISLFPDENKLQLRLAAPIIEWIDLHAEGLGGEKTDISVHFAGWGGIDPASHAFESDHLAKAEVTLGNIRLRAPTAGFNATLGRQFLLLGLGRAEWLDGAHIWQDLPAGFRIELFGGGTPGHRLTYESGSYMYGARLSHRWRDVITTGVSFVQARQDGDIARELVGGDVVVRPKDWVEFGAGALADTVGKQLAQFDVFGTFYPRDGMRAGVDWRRVVPVALLDKTSIFSVFSDMVRDEVGGDFSFKLGQRVRLTVDAHWLAFDAGDNGYRAGVSTQVRLGSTYRTALTARVGRWRDSTDGYYEFRAAARHSMTRALFCVLDMQAYAYDVGNGKDAFSFGTTAALGYEVAKHLRALISVDGGITPSFERRGQVMAKLEYDFLRVFK